MASSWPEAALTRPKGKPGSYALLWLGHNYWIKQNALIRD